MFITSNKKTPLDYLFILLPLITLFTFYYGLSIYGLANNNEGLYAEAAKEMYFSHQHIIPTLSYLPYIEKPPLLYWLINASFHIFGVNTFAARLIPATSGIIACFSLVFFTKKINRLQEGLLAALILSTSLGFVLIARIVFFDMLLTAMISLCLINFYLAWLQGKKPFLYAGYIFLGLAVLTKSLVSLVLVGLIMGSFLILTQTFRSHAKLFFNPLGIFFFLLVTLPWHILAALQHPSFFQDFFINEQFLRFLDQRVPHDYYEGPLYYYFPRMILYLFPWGILLPLLALKKYRQNLLKDPLKIFLWLWFLVSLIFFSTSKAKANYYMVVSCPALALLLAAAIWQDFSQQRWLSFWRSIIGIFVILSFSSIAFAAHIAKQYEDNFSAKNLAQFLQTDKKPIFIYQEFERISSLLFYLNQPLKIIDVHSKDLWYGLKFAPKNWSLPTKKFAKNTMTDPYYVILRRERLAEFHKKTPALQFYPKASFGEWLVLSNL